VKSELGGTAASVDIGAIIGRGVAGRIRGALLSVVGVLTLAAALLAPASANAAEPTSGYTVPKTQEPTSGYTVPATEPPKSEAPKSEASKPPPGSQTTTPETGSSPSKESEKPLVEEGHTGVLPENERLAGEAPAKAGALPFTGLDLRWELGFGVLLMATGLALVAAQRRRGRLRRR
jgi:hypothetical protein